MTRHGRNNTASACYTYHERQRDAKASGYGTLKARLGKESVKDFDACCLTLQPCRNPVITPEGYLFDKEAIYEYIITKKAENIKKLKEYEKQKKKEFRDLEEIAEAEARSKSEQFIQEQKNILSKTEGTIPVGSGISNMSEGHRSQLPSFWVPSQTPASEKSTSYLKEPDQTVYCPMSGKPLRGKDLYEVVFTPIDAKPDASTASATRTERYMCPVTHDVLGNSVPCTYLRTSKSVVTSECVEKIIRKDMLDPINGKKLREKDLIPLQRGGTGFASTNSVEAAISKPAIQA